MTKKSMTLYEAQLSDIREQIDIISSQLCSAVHGNFDFKVDINGENVDETVQKLSMLLNFVIDTVRRALAEIQEKNAKLTELTRLKSDFMANMSHEFRTPLTLIMGPLDNILSDQKNPVAPEHFDNLKRMQRNALRLYVLVNDFLNFSKLEAGKYEVNKEVLDLSLLISQLIEDIQDQAHNQKLTLTFETQLQKEDCMLFDRKMIEKIILNLVSNALKFTPAGGSIQVVLSYGDKGDNNNVYISVKDSGIGIPANQIDKLFERFHQIDSSRSRSYEGTGIGLALINEFASLMGGHIDVLSEEGKGSEFIVVLPICRTASEASQEAIQEMVQEATQKTEINSNKIALAQMTTSAASPSEDISSVQKTNKMNGETRIILAEDNPDMRHYICSLIDDTYEVTTFENGQLALDEIRKEPPHLILTDAMMPVMDGYDLIKNVKSEKSLRHIPIIMLTAQAGEEATVTGLDTGADDYLSKPFSPKELRARIASSLRITNHYLEMKSLNTRLSEANYILSKEIDERKELEIKNVKLNEQLIASARRAGMADISTSILHNIGNILNGVNTSVSMIKNKISQSKISQLNDLNVMIAEHQNDLSDFILNDPKGKHIPNYLVKLADMWQNDRKYLLEEICSLSHSLQHIRDIAITQNSFSKSLGMIQPVALDQLIEDALLLNKTAYEQNQVNVVRNFAINPTAEVDRVALLQIIVNIIKNGIESIVHSKNEHKNLSLSILEKDEDACMIKITDSGSGIDPGHTEKIFSQGFTTKVSGHGFGLHSSAVAIQEMKGELYAESQGLGMGATFTLVLPYRSTKMKGREKHASI